MKASRLISVLLLLVAVFASATYWITRIHALSAEAAHGAAISTPFANKSSGSATVALFGERPKINPTIGNLRVTGVVIDPNPADSIAILVDSARARAFRIGAEIVPGVHLAEVYRRYVMVSDGKNRTRIDIPERAMQAAAEKTEAQPETEQSSSVNDGGLRGEPPHRTGNPNETQGPNDSVPTSP